jgi:hypothetical protein
MWHEHDGGPWPEHADPEDLVEVEYRDGLSGTKYVRSAWSDDDKLNLWLHQDPPSMSDIMRYRIITDVA